MTDHERKLAAAAKRVAAMDKSDGHEDRSIGTIIAAIKSGLLETNNDAAYDALVMLEDIRASIEKRPILNVMSLKTLYNALDAGGIVVADPKNN